jgi:two-component system, sensor histidine kinase RegB
MMAAIPDRNRLNFSWLMKLRWAEIAGQTATILGVYWLLDIGLPLAALAAIVGVKLVSNVACALWFRGGPSVSEWQLAAVMALDVAILTALLYFTGGPFNPFSFLYLVQIALAAVVLRAHWTWMLVALSLGSFGLLLVGHRPLPLEGLSYAEAHKKGMWVALGVASAFIVHFLLRVTGALAERERELGEARNLAARQERLASLATMAAGAAHELSTPLGTIALVAKELERALSRGGDEVMAEDARLIREQVGRCRVILDQMAGGAGESAGEGVESVTVGEVLGEALTGSRAAPPVRREVEPAVEQATVRLPPRAVAQAVRSVVTNAQDASRDGEPVVLAAAIEGGRLRIEVRDRGRGMTPAVLARLGEPFFTTKAPGHGMGLGLFLTRAVVESLGGTLAIDSRMGRGTTVTMSLPTAVEPAARADAEELRVSG